jgi:hypothetical protein
VIAYYVHHHGSGHVHRAAAVAAATRTPVVGLSSRPAPDGWAGDWVELPLDSDGSGTDGPDTDGGDPPADVTAGGVLHWAPRRHPGLNARMRRIGAVLAQADLVVVDVSVEVALLARLHGVPVVVVAQPGDRLDRPHRLAYDLAERLVAPWPERPAPGWPDAWTAKTVHVGAVSRFDGRPPPPAPGAGRRVLVAWGSGGLDVGPAELRAAAAATPGWRWDVIGPGVPVGPDPANLTGSGWAADVWPRLCAADVVVTHAGQNALAEVAAARRPAVVVPQDRPHGEQHATADALARAGIAVPVGRWPAAANWPAVLDTAARRGGTAWERWSGGDGAARVAAVLDDL